MYGADGFATLLLRHKPGDMVTLTAQGNGQPQQQDVQVMLVQYPKR